MKIVFVQFSNFSSTGKRKQEKKASSHPRVNQKRGEKKGVEKVAQTVNEAMSL
jgi:hypothetical protein